MWESVLIGLGTSLISAQQQRDALKAEEARQREYERKQEEILKNTKPAQPTAIFQAGAPSQTDNRYGSNIFLTSALGFGA